MRQSSVLQFNNSRLIDHTYPKTEMLRTEISQRIQGRSCLVPASHRLLLVIDSRIIGQRRVAGPLSLGVPQVSIQPYSWVTPL